MRTISLVFLIAGISAAQDAGLPPEWEVRKQLDELVQQTKRFDPVLDQLQPENWIANGAPEAYVTQFKSLRDEVKYLGQVAGNLSRQPERMSVAFDAYQRMQLIESRLQSLAEGIRRYQNPAVADLLLSLVSETNGSRDRLRQYVFELIVQREKERDVLEKEAQRCRATVSQKIVAPATTPKIAPPKPNAGEIKK
ncbi:MAG: hypothetical protein K2Q23_17835 [Bryobacteraceae bacterium]|nr:hypothetical protein [Bryobacteraceae bacterium]